MKPDGFYVVEQEGLTSVDFRSAATLKNKHVQNENLRARDMGGLTEAESR